jgi:hypothetical protein
LALYLNKFESPSPKDNLYQVWLNFARWFWRRRFKKKKVQCIFTLSLLSTLKEGLFPSFEQNWIPFNQEKFVLNLIEFGLLFSTRRFLKIFSVFLLFYYYLPFEMGYSKSLNKLEFPSLKYILYLVWLNLTCWF